MGYKTVSQKKDDTTYVQSVTNNANKYKENYVPENQLTYVNTGAQEKPSPRVGLNNFRNGCDLAKTAQARTYANISMNGYQYNDNPQP